MATTDQELKKLNKTVEDAVNIMKVYAGNSANIKNMNEKQKEAISKWFEVVTEEEHQQKKQRAFTERARDENGRFLKKKDDQAKKMMGMAGSISGMFKGMTKTIGTSLTTMFHSVSGHFMTFFNNMKSHFLGLFGEESEWFDILGSIKDSLTGFVGWFAKGFAMLFRKTPSWASDMNKTLQGMYHLQVKEMKMDFLDAGGKKKKGGGGILGLVGGLLGALIFSIGASFGGFIHRYFVLVTKLPIFQKIAMWFTKIDDLPFIGKLFKAIKFGFKWLGWPLTVILSVIDFIRGYAETEGSMFEKIKEGLWKALAGFIELPVRFLGWIYEKVLELFGIEVNGIADKMMGFFKQTFELALNGWVMIFKLMKTTWSSIVEWVLSKVPDIGDLKDRAIALFAPPSPDMSMNSMPDISPIDVVQATDKAKSENQKEGYKLLGKSLDAMGESVKASNRKTGDAISAIQATTQNNSSGGDGGQQQISDEIDNGLVSVNNYGGGMA